MIKAKRSDPDRVEKSKTARVSRLSRTRTPEGVSPQECERALGRQFGGVQIFLLDNLGAESVLAEFRVDNPQSKTRDLVEIRGQQ